MPMRAMSTGIFFPVLLFWNECRFDKGGFSTSSKFYNQWWVLLINQWRSKVNSGLQPSPRIQTYCLCQCQKAVTAFHLYWKRCKMFSNMFLFAEMLKTIPFAVWALVMVSCVVNVLEAIRKKVRSGFDCFNVFSNMCSIPRWKQNKFQFLFASELQRFCYH